MKTILSYLLLCTYAMIMIKPVMPTITDIFAHLLNYKDHMATVHHEHGKYHVHYEYIEEAKKHTHGDMPYNNSIKKTGAFDEHILFTTLTDLSTLQIRPDHSILLSRYLPAVFLQNDLRPPIMFTA